MVKFLLFPLVAVVLHAQMVDGIAVRVGDAIITTYEIQKEMQLAHVDKKQAQEMLIRKKLEEQELKKRGIAVSESEVYDEIRRLASANHMTIGQFYDAVRNSNGLSSTQLKEKVKERLLSQKLYRAVAMSKMKEPDMHTIEEYYKLHKAQFSQAAYYDVVIYIASSKKLLEQKQHNPMFFSPEISQQDQRITPNRVNPQLVQLFEQAGEGNFTPVVPSANNKFMTVYVKKIGPRTEVDIEQVKPQIINAIMAEQRKEILDDYFAKLQENADIKVIR
jgi:hypothetical protein